MNEQISVLICRSNPVSPDPRVEKEAHSLIQAGYRVQILGWDRSGELPTLEESAQGVIHRLGIRAGYARGIWNFFPLLRWQFGLLNWLMKHANEFEVIHACDFDTILPALVCKKLKRKKVIYDIFDFYAEHLRNTPGGIKRLIHSADLRAIDQADGVIIVDDARIKQIEGAHPKHLTVIYNSPQDVMPTPNQSANGRDLHPIRIAYIGLLQFERGLNEILEVLERHPDWMLDLAGFGGDETAILAKAARLSNVHWHGRIPYKKALELSSRANVLVALYDPAIPNHKVASPNKIFEAMMLGKPVIVARGTNMDRIIEDAQAGLVVPYGNTDELEAALLYLEKNPGIRDEFGKAARRAYETLYSWAVMEKRLLDLYRTITPATD